MIFSRTLAAVFALGVFVCAIPAYADQLDAARTLIGLAAIGNFPDRTETVGALPDHLMSGVPMPAGLQALGGATGTSADGNAHAEALFFSASSGSALNYPQYSAELTNAGWTTTTPPTVFAMPTTFATYCKTGSPEITVQTSGNYMVVRAFGQGCPSSIGSLASRQIARTNRAPLPQLSPPDGASFQRSTTSYGGTSSLAAATLHATQDIPSLLALFSKQMTAAGWTQYGTSGSEGAAFMFHPNAGRNWIASLAVVRTSSDQYAVTVSAFEVDSQNSI